MQRFFGRRATIDSDRRGGRVIDCSGLENRRTERYRGFESLPLRNLKRKLLDDSNLRFFLQKSFRVPKIVPKVCGNHVRISQKHRI